MRFLTSESIHRLTNASSISISENGGNINVNTALNVFKAIYDSYSEYKRRVGGDDGTRLFIVQITLEGRSRELIWLPLHQIKAPFYIKSGRICYVGEDGVITPVNERYASFPGLCDEAGYCSDGCYFLSFDSESKSWKVDRETRGNTVALNLKRVILLFDFIQNHVNIEEIRACEVYARHLFPNPIHKNQLYENGVIKPDAMKHLRSALNRGDNCLFFSPKPRILASNTKTVYVYEPNCSVDTLLEMFSENKRITVLSRLNQLRFNFYNAVVSCNNLQELIRDIGNGVVGDFATSIGNILAPNGVFVWLRKEKGTVLESELLLHFCSEKNMKGIMVLKKK